ncbi:hypothetical protein VB773_20330 [Haloarculaceae archaeon H-GB2-1]|nr:hypothetical protein [Haloarculaceae archaeon H-GB1-1]MEA5389196.1 hypothetical protein [Haloarculaceae archaeon H-GB11]MEA5409690.1 hypothetical protein [Haloarculaceae archaeon H-GB2-1]
MPIYVTIATGPRIRGRRYRSTRRRHGTSVAEELDCGFEHCDVTDYDEVESVVETVVDEYRQLDEWERVIDDPVDGGWTAHLHERGRHDQRGRRPGVAAHRTVRVVRRDVAGGSRTVAHRGQGLPRGHPYTRHGRPPRIPRC